MTQRRVFAIDPGSEQSAWLLYDNGFVIEFGIEPNEHVRERTSCWSPKDAVTVAIEQVASYGMAVGRDVFETVYWSGRFAEAAAPVPVDRITRGDVKLHLCGSRRAKDANVRQALIDRYGGVGGKDTAVGRKAAPGPLYKVSRDVWSALALAVTWADTHPGEEHR